jgi:hypothetical protein
MGYADLGNGPDTSIEAKEALVFMLVGLYGSWKCPFAYFLTCGISAETQAQLIKMAVSTIEKEGFVVKAITMDGHRTNMSMAELLGAKFEPLKTCSPYFESPGNNKIYFTFDACHILKLFRNMLQSYRYLKDDQNQVIAWDHIVRLNNLQQSHGLKLANKLTDRHIFFENQKMKVCLAAQTLSSSVANALRTMKQIDTSFEDCEATAKFVEVQTPQKT